MKSFLNVINNLQYIHLCHSLLGVSSDFSIIAQRSVVFGVWHRKIQPNFDKDFGVSHGHYCYRGRFFACLPISYMWTHDHRFHINSLFVHIDCQQRHTISGRHSSGHADQHRSRGRPWRHGCMVSLAVHQTRWLILLVFASVCAYSEWEKQNFTFLKQSVFFVL